MKKLLCLLVAGIVIFKEIVLPYCKYIQSLLHALYSYPDNYFSIDVKKIQCLLVASIVIFKGIVLPYCIYIQSLFIQEKFRAIQYSVGASSIAKNT